jgi:hypothetical protein
VEPPKLLILEGFIDIFHGTQGGQLLEHTDQPFERHIIDHGGVVWIDGGLPPHCSDYIIPIQFWIDQSCVNSCPP